MAADYIGRGEACRLLEVKPQTLYAYVSRGLVRTAEASGTGRAGLYSRADVETLKARSRARRGHGAVAADAMRWGEPVLESAITRLGEDDIYYRGLPLRQLMQRRVSFERCAELIWSGMLPARDVVWSAAEAKAESPKELTYQSLNVALANAAGAEAVDSTLDETLASVRGFLLSIVGGGKVKREVSFAERLTTKLGAAKVEGASALLNAALVASADFELSASTFTARIAASTGGSVHACLQAGLAAFSGRVHGAQVDQAEALVAGLLAANDVNALAKTWGRDHGEVPGFGQKLYPKGDPRAEALAEALAEFATGLSGAKAREQRELAAAARVIAKTTGLAPNLEWTLACIGRGLALKPGTSFAVFSLGRMVGWVAHVVEQRQQGYVLRPRAKYVGR